MNKRGLTIVELIIVIVIMGIIATFSVIGVSRYLTNAKLKVDKEVVTSLNKATTSYYLIGRNTPIFDESNTDEERMQILVTEGFLSNIPTPNTENAKFIWDQDLNLWCLSIDGEVTALSPYGSTPVEITSTKQVLMVELGEIIDSLISVWTKMIGTNQSVMSITLHQDRKST